MGKDLTCNEEQTLEMLVDGCGLVAVLHSLSSICGQKAEHIQESYNDAALAKLWRIAEGRLGFISCDASIQAIGEP